MEVFLKHIHSEDLTKVQETANHGLKSHQKWQGEYRIITKTGTELYWHGTGIAVYDQEGNPIKVVGAITDITKRKWAEEQLRIKDRAMASSFNGIVIADLNGKLIYINDAFSRMWGYTVQDASNVNITNLDSNKDEIIHIINNIKERGFSYGESVAIRKDGSLFDIQYFASLITNSSGKPIAMLSNFVDITERKQSEEKLRRSEEKYRLVTENASDVIWTMDLNFQFTYISPSNEKLTGYTSEKMKNITLNELLTPASVEKALQVFEGEMQLENSNKIDISRSVTLELDEIRADGTIFPIEARMSLLRDVNKNPIGILGITRDITERKRQEDSLKKSEEKFIKAFRSSPIAICVTRISDGRFLEINPALERLIGYTRDEILSQTTLGLGMWVDISERKLLFDDLAKTGSVYNREYRFRSKKGTIIYTRYSGEKINFSGDDSIISVLIDITEQKKAIDLLRKSEEKFVKAFNSSPVAICITRMCDGKFIEVNESLLQLSGYNRIDLLEKSTIELNLWTGDEDRKQVVEQLRMTGTVRDQEFRFRVKDGKEIFVRYSAELIDFSGERCVLSVLTDITARKKIEESLRESEERYRGLVENIQDLIMVTDPEGRVSYISPVCYKVIGYNKDDLIGTIPKIFYPEDNEKVNAKISEAIKGISGSNFEYRIQTKTGEIIWISHSWTPIFTKDHKLKFVVSIIKNITASKIDEKNLKAKIEELEKYKNVTINREIKMVDLKNEVNELCKLLNQKPKYPNV
jgi:PAS domain S-box-containing protein